jgi:hypothetical protein
VGQGGVLGFNQNGSTSENNREFGLDHLSNEAVLWKASPDENVDADGGWKTSFKNIDRTKTYRLTVWIKKTNSAGGRTYFGLDSRVGFGSECLNLDGTVNNDPYFFESDLPILDRWYLLIGFIHKSTYSSTNSQGAIYDGVTGEVVSSINIRDFKFSNNAINLRHKSYLNFDSDINDRQFFYEPRMEIAEGSEMPINEILGINANSQLLFVYDNAGSQKQRFYCQSSGCVIPNPPQGIIENQDEVSKQSVVLEESKSKYESENPLSDVETGLSEMTTINIYPNPTTGKATIELPRDSNTTIETISIYTAKGTLVNTYNLRGQDQYQSIMDIENNAVGIYFIHMHGSNGEVITKKIIKN